MNIHIQLDRFDRGIIFWIADDHTRSGAYLPAHDPYNLNSINQQSEARLRRILEITSDDNWSAYAIDAETFAIAISSCFHELIPSFHNIFEDSPSFLIPEPLRKALQLEEHIVTVGVWIQRFPVVEQ